MASEKLINFLRGLFGNAFYQKGFLTSKKRFWRVLFRNALYQRDSQLLKIDVFGINLTKSQSSSLWMNLKV